MNASYEYEPSERGPAYLQPHRGTAVLVLGILSLVNGIVTGLISFSPLVLRPVSAADVPGRGAPVTGGSAWVAV